MSGELIDVDDLVFDAGNVRKRTEKNKKAISDSVTQFGAGRSILIDADGIIRAGNGTANAWLEHGGKVRVIESDGSELIAVKRTDLRGAEAVAYAIADNRSAELAEWDEGLVAQLDSLQADGFDVSELGFDQDALDELGSRLDLGEDPSDIEDVEPQIDRGDELQAEWGTAEGQLWIIEGKGKHRLLCGDSANREQVLMLLDGGRADMVLTDPPYGVAYVGKTKDALKVENDDCSEDELQTMVEQWFNNAAAASRDGAYWYATVPAGPLHTIFADDWKSRGILRQIMVWVKDSMVLGHSEYHYRHEPILFGWVPGPRHKNSDRTRTTVFEFARPKASREHPTMKPLDLWCTLMVDGSRPGELVFEPFCGSGTTMLAAEQLGRRCYGMEISPKYVAVILQRMKDAGCECTLSE